MMNSQTDPSVRTQSTSIPAWLLPTLIVFGLLAALGTEPVVNSNRERFFTPTGLPPFPPELMWKVFWDNVYNHTICYGFLGVITCGLVGLAAGASVSPMKAILGGITGALVGLFAGALLGVGGWYLSERVLGTSDLDSMIKALLIFIPFWFGLACTASFVALFLAKRLRYFARTVANTFAFAVFAVIAYIGIVTVAFPTDWPGRIIPEFARVRLVLEITGCLGVVTAAFGALSASDHMERKSRELPAG
jgi:hypothetical protein